jgi:hypothetical protein
MKLSTTYSWVGLGRRVQAWGSDGDFITPAGKVIPVGENHTIFMMQHPEQFGGETDPEAVVYSQGWIRTRGIGGTFSIQADGGMNEMQLHVLQKMVRERCRYSDPRIEVLMDDDDVYELTCDDFDYIESPNQIKRGLRSM